MGLTARPTSSTRHNQRGIVCIRYYKCSSTASSSIVGTRVVASSLSDDDCKFLTSRKVEITTHISPITTFFARLFPTTCTNCFDVVFASSRYGPFLVAWLKPGGYGTLQISPVVLGNQLSGSWSVPTGRSCIGESVDLSRIGLDLGDYYNLGGVALELRLTSREQKFGIALEVRILERRAADGQVAVG